MSFFQRAVDYKAAQQRHRNPHQGANHLSHQGYAASTAQRLQTKNPRRYAAPGTTEAMQWPHPKHIINLPAVLGGSKQPHKQGASHSAHHQAAEWMHDVRAGAHRHQAASGPL